MRAASKARRESGRVISLRQQGGVGSRPLSRPPALRGQTGGTAASAALRLGCKAPAQRSRTLSAFWAGKEKGLSWIRGSRPGPPSALNFMTQTG